MVSTEERIEQDQLSRVTQGMLAAAAKKRFRGSIAEFIRHVPMGRGYANENEPFDIETACYLKPVDASIRNPDKPVTCCLAAVQMLKTFFCVEAAAGYFIANDPGDTTIYIGGDDSASDQARARLLPYLRGIPEVARQLNAAAEANRWDVTTQEFYLPAMILRIWGLNMNTTQRITLRRVIISDAFLTKKTGMIAQAVARTTQHRRDRKVIVESQGGDAGDDMDEFWKTTSQGWLHVRCPECQRAQPFDFHRERPEDFLATPPRTIPSLDHAAWVEHHSPILRSPDRKHCGFKRGDDDLIKRADGSYNEAEILRQTYYECYHCGAVWRDTPATRQVLDESSHYVSQNPNALPGYDGFSWPAWAGRRLPWGGEEVMLGYLRAKKANDEFGNVEPLKQWYQKRHARPWDANLIRTIRVQTYQFYDAKSDWPEEWRGHRALVVDCQQDLQYFWTSLWAVSPTGKSRQLWRGILHGFGDPKLDAKDQPNTLTGKQKEFGVLDQFVFLDGGYMKNELIEECAKHGHWVTIEGEREWLCWTILIGSPQKDFAHKADKNPKVRHPVSDPFYEYPEVRVGGYRVSVEIFYFSALQMGDMFTRYRDGRGPETLFLPETEPPDKKTSWTAQINAVTKQHLVNNRTGESTEIWKPATQTTPHHYFDVGRMFMAVLCLWGVAGEDVKLVEAKAEETPPGE